MAEGNDIFDLDFSLEDHLGVNLSKQPSQIDTEATTAKTEEKQPDWKTDSTAWLARNRKKTAQSSRKSRQKRKAQEDTVYQENKRYPLLPIFTPQLSQTRSFRLKEDRVKCLAEIESLEQSIRTESLKRYVETLSPIF